jgi:hypothetical protein
MLPELPVVLMMASDIIILTEIFLSGIVTTTNYFKTGGRIP